MYGVGQDRAGARRSTMHRNEILVSLRQHKLRRYGSDPANCSILDNLARLFDDRIMPPMMADKKCNTRPL
ncbi:MAG: hypothetical protein JZU55_18140, partial [Afipia sp.]|nr:hypothetical protein [Afipia sp.]